MKKILIGPASFSQINNVAEKKLEELGFYLVKNKFHRKIKTNELIEILSDKNIVGSIGGLENYTSQVLKESNLRVISRLGSGLDNIDLDTAKTLNIKIFSTPSGPINSVAELVIGMMISLSRKISMMDSDMKSKNWNRMYGSLIYDKQITLVGYGKIGKKVHELLKPFNSKINIVDPSINNKSISNLLSLEDALPISDIISFHIDKNIEIISRKNIDKIKSGCILLNSSRGNIISEENLIYGIENKIISSAWLDVYNEEPYQGKLCNYKELILTPHIGSLTTETRLAMEIEAVNNLIKVF